MRSFRAEKVSAFVKAVLDCEMDSGSEKFLKLISGRYPNFPVSRYKPRKAMD